jgi:OmpA-OmpF porin, OOP family
MLCGRSNTPPVANMFLRAFFALLVAVLGSTAQAQRMPADAPGGKDHPLISRYAGSWLAGYENKEFDAVSIPSGPQAVQAAAVEGRVTRLYYLAPAGRSVLEVQRNYEQALEKAGATRRDSCAAPACGERALGAFDGSRGKQVSTGEVDGYSAVTMIDQWLDRDSLRWWYGTVSSGGTVVHVSVVSAKQGLVVMADKHVATVVQIVEPKAMQGGQVTVDAAALARGLQAEGKIALYGVFFDTGKSDVKPESKPQLDEMAKLLQSNAALRVHVVGHTDNQGTLDGNLALSRARAQAVVEALVKTYKVNAQRLSAAGVASYAPVASNSNEAGRARNRRVELVVQ